MLGSSVFFFFFFSLANVAHVLEGKKGNFRNFGSWEIGKILDFFSRLNLTNFANFGGRIWQNFQYLKIEGKRKRKGTPHKKEVKKVVIILEYLAKSDYKPEMKGKSLIILLSFWLHTENQNKIK